MAILWHFMLGQTLYIQQVPAFKRTLLLVNMNCSYTCILLFFIQKYNLENVQHYTMNNWWFFELMTSFRHFLDQVLRATIGMYINTCYLIHQRILLFRYVNLEPRTQYNTMHTSTVSLGFVKPDWGRPLFCRYYSFGDVMVYDRLVISMVQLWILRKSQCQWLQSSLHFYFLNKRSRLGCRLGNVT